MKVFHVIDGICHWDATRQFPTAQATVGKYPPDCLFVDAPDYVFEGWGYDAETRRFIKPQPPEGWLYDDATGTFYPADQTPPVRELSPIEAAEQEITDLELSLIETQQEVTELELMILEGSNGNV